MYTTLILYHTINDKLYTYLCNICHKVIRYTSYYIILNLLYSTTIAYMGYTDTNLYHAIYYTILYTPYICIGKVRSRVTLTVPMTHSNRQVQELHMYGTLSVGYFVKSQHATAPKAMLTLSYK